MLQSPELQQNNTESVFSSDITQYPTLTFTTHSLADLFNQTPSLGSINLL